jgi:hypothetical protein
VSPLSRREQLACKMLWSCEDTLWWTAIHLSRAAAKTSTDGANSAALAYADLSVITSTSCPTANRAAGVGAAAAAASIPCSDSQCKNTTLYPMINILSAALCTNVGASSAPSLSLHNECWSYQRPASSTSSFEWAL